MPKAVAVRYRDYCGMSDYLRSQGFREMSRGEVRDDVIAHGLKNHRKNTEAEKGFVLTYKGFTVKVWSSCLRKRVDDCARRYVNYPLLRESIGDEVVSRPVGMDMGWVIITDPTGKAQYFATPFHWTKNFILSICEWARITQLKVEHRPLCKECQKYMEIRVEESRATYWACFRMSEHASRKPVFLDWDHALPEAAKKVVEKRRKKRKSWQGKKRELVAQGKKPPQLARKLRKPWVATKKPYAA